MSEEIKKPFDLGPILPMFGAGVDLGERLGDLAKGQKQLESSLKEVKQDIKEVKQDLKELDAKLSAKIEAVDGRVDKCLVAINRLDERTKNLDSKFNLSIGLTCAVLATVIAGFIIQFFSK